MHENTEDPVKYALICLAEKGKGIQANQAPFVHTAHNTNEQISNALVVHTVMRG
jgi:hypothetical protein